MEEGGHRVADKTEFTECWHRTNESPYIMRLAYLLALEVFSLVMIQETLCISYGYCSCSMGHHCWKNFSWFGSWCGFHDCTSIHLEASLLRSEELWSVSMLSSSLVAPGTWRWMLGVAGIPAMIQFILMLSLPESPRWLYRQNKEEEARHILSKIYRPGEVEEEMRAMQESIETEKAEEGLMGIVLHRKLRGALASNVVRRALYAGITVQVSQQFVGINTVMYYSPTIVQFAGIASNSTALCTFPVTSGLNAVGSILSMLSLIDLEGETHHAPAISNQDTLSFGSNSTCKAYTKTPNFTSWNCMQCMQVNCAFCANSESKKIVVWFSQGCPSRIGIFAVVILGLYIIAYSPGMGTVPWVLNSEIYPLRFRGVGGGIAAVFNWCANLIVSESFLSMIKAIGTSGTFLLFAGFSLIGLVAIYALVPETKGLQFEEVEKLLQRLQTFPIDRKKEDNKGKEQDLA
ncbi:Sugar/inositol transporter [Sesbania bispinosa]|nr:Sugar/inositol transporter [Sesbania bispinosa]